MASRLGAIAISRVGQGRIERGVDAVCALGRLLCYEDAVLETNPKSPTLQRSSNKSATVFLQAKEVYGENHVLQYEGEENVQVETFDSFQLDDVHFMKIDVEGALDKVLRGGQQTIQRFRPIIACEHGEETAPELLLAWGYHCVLVLPVHDLWVCVPEEKWWRHRWLAVADFGFDRHSRREDVGHAGEAAYRGTDPPKLSLEEAIK